MPASGDKVKAADVDDLGDYTIRMPLVRLVQQSAQSISDSTDTALTFGASSEDIDTHGFHDTASNTSRVTPSVAGYYRITGTYITTARTDYNTVVATIGKNGTVQAPRDRTGPNATSSARSAGTSVIMSANGSTDYFELIVLQDNVANAAVNTSTGGSFASVLEVEFLRPL